MRRDQNRLAPLTFCACAIVLSTFAHAQVGTPIASRFPGPEEAFEIASVKPNRSAVEVLVIDSISEPTPN